MIPRNQGNVKSKLTPANVPAFFIGGVMNKARREEAARLLAWRLKWPTEQYAEMAQHFEDVRRFSRHGGANETKLRKWLREVEDYYASGLSQAEFCQRRHYSERTLREHIAKLEAKLPAELRLLKDQYQIG